MKKLIGEGAEAKIYSLKIFGTDAIVKDRCSKAYRQKDLDAFLRSSRTRKEAKIMLNVKKHGVNAPTVIGVGKFTIYMNKLYGQLLRDLKLNSKLLHSAAAMLARMHAKNIVHGDFTPANLMLCNGQIFVIDFGLADTTSSIEEKATDLLLMKRSLSPAQYSEFEKFYISEKGSKSVTERLEEIERRGRYQIRSLSTT